MFSHFPSFDPKYFQQLPPDRLLHSRVLPTAHLPGVPTTHRPGAGSSFSCWAALFLHNNCPSTHPWLSPSHHPRQCWTPAKSACPFNPGKEFNPFGGTHCYLFTSEPEHSTGIEQQSGAGTFVNSTTSKCLTAILIPRWLTSERLTAVKACHPSPS